ncbi:hypothetical protein VKT23_005010 [Stygiomarasmius scandens]|uniref:Cytochrome P450 n=1 Tax=Marasmiellus scandens TaxID=2682957 RepID=A0ABR1JUQ9_9AGAR
MSRTALELVGQAGLGYSFDTLADEAEAHPYTNILKEMMPTAARTRIIRTYVLPIVLQTGVPDLWRWILGILPWKDGHHIRDMSDYMWNLSKEIYEGKQKALAEGDEVVAKQVGKGKDILSILMRLNQHANDEDRLDVDEVLGQMSTLIFAAMDTTSGALTRILHLLATHPEAQDKLRQEVLNAQQNGQDLDYDTLTSLPYLDAICRETLRLYPPISHIVRHANQDTILPLSSPIIGLDGTNITEIHLRKNTTVLVSVLNSNRNSALWGSDAGEWKPERWLSPLPDALIEAHLPGIYSHMMTFNAGGRSCIGFKFSQLEMKAVLSMLVAKFRFCPTKREIFWQMNDIVNPVVEGDDNPRLPLLISAV